MLTNATIIITIDTHPGIVNFVRTNYRTSSQQRKEPFHGTSKKIGNTVKGKNFLATGYHLACKALVVFIKPSCALDKSYSAVIQSLKQTSL